MDTKSLFMSKTFWGVVVSMFGKLAAVGGYTVMPEDEATLTAFVSLLASGIGDMLAVYGRVKATKAIK